jgi:acyl dehydratase
VSDTPRPAKIASWGLAITTLPADPCVHASTVNGVAAAAYAAILREPDATGESGAIPSTFVTVLTGEVLRQVVDATLPEPAQRRGVVAMHHIRMLGSLEPGLVLEHRAAATALSTGPRGVRVDFEIVSSAEGRAVAEQHLAIVVLGASNPVEIGVVRPEAPPELGARAARIALPLDEDLPLRYASLTGEDAPVHVSREAAQELGFAAPILQGSCTMALTAARLARAMSGRGPDAVSAIAMRFRAPVLVPGSLSLRYAALDPSDASICGFEARAGGAAAGDGVLALRG